MERQKRRIKGFIYLLLLSNIAVASFQIVINSPVVKIILASYMMISLLIAIIYIKKDS